MVLIMGLLKPPHGAFPWPMRDNGICLVRSTPYVVQRREGLNLLIIVIHNRDNYAPLWELVFAGRKGLRLRSSPRPPALEDG